MQIEYRIITLNDSALTKIGLEGWQLCDIDSGKMYFSREIKKTRKEKKAEHSEEYEKFHDLYPKKSGITSDSVINKINTAVKEGRFERIMEGVERYVKMIKVENIVPKFILNAETFLNQKRYEDPFDIFENRVPIAESWILPMIKDLNELDIKEAMRLKKDWEAKQKKDITPGTMENIIKRVLGEEI